MTEGVVGIVAGLVPGHSRAGSGRTSRPELTIKTRFCTLSPSLEPHFGRVSRLVKG